MTATQPELIPPADDATAHKVRLLVALLDDAGDWLPAAEIARLMGIDDRHVRRLAEHADGLIVSGPGCPGYRHIRHCTNDDIRHTADRLRSQARRMLARSIRIRRLAHAAIG